MLKVGMVPRPSDAAADTSNSINQCVLRLAKTLPEFGVELVESGQVDLTAFHAGMAPGSKAAPIHIAHLHGLYPTADRNTAEGWHWSANATVIQNMRGAKAVTVPSEWVADILRRDMHLQPHVIGWGVDLQEWNGASNQGYVLFNKNRTDGVCSPVPVTQLAMRRQNVSFLSTFATPGAPSNVRTTGRVVYEQMREMVKGAAVYLATTKETFGIGTLEAMACGVPVLAFRHGATRDLIEHGVTGYLVDPGDYDGLATGLDYCVAYRHILGANAREAVKAHTWQRVAQSFAEVYQQALRPHEGPKVSIVIPCYNYANYVTDAIQSAGAQTLSTGKIEIIVVNDGSRDASHDVALAAIDKYAPGALLIDKDNGGVAEARNSGIKAAKGEYVVCLDADDKIEPGFVQALADTLDSDPSLGIAFAALRMMNAQGELGNVSNWPSGWNYDNQLGQFNQVPTCCMFRREAWARAGGFRKAYSPAEDAELWTRIGALGYGGKQATDKPLFLYRLHDQSLSTPVRTGKATEPNWRDKPWIADKQHPVASQATPAFHSHPVRNYDRPKVSVIIPVGPDHFQYVAEAIDSLEMQTERGWECLVVNDTGDDVPGHLTDAYPFVRWLTTGHRGVGPARARNVGVAAAAAKLVAFLDADDIFHALFIEHALKAHVLNPTRYVYTDWVSLNKAGQYETHATPEYSIERVFHETTPHSVNILISREDFMSVGGFDESMKSWEDTDLILKLAAAGLCGQRVGEALTLYRYTTGHAREDGVERHAEIKALLSDRYRDYISGGKTPVCCGDKPSGTAGALPPLAMEGAVQPGAVQGVRIQFAGPMGMADVIGPATRRNYGRRKNGDIFYVDVADQRSQPARFQIVVDTTEIVQPTLPPPPPTPRPAPAQTQGATRPTGNPNKLPDGPIMVPMAPQ